MKIATNRRSYRVTSELIPSMSMYVQTAAHNATNSQYIAKRKKYDSVLIVYTISGKGHLKYDNKEYNIKKDCGFIIDCNRPQIYYCDKNEASWEFLWLHINGGRSIEQANFICSTVGPVLNNLEKTKIRENMQNVINLISTQGIYYDILISNYLSQIMGDLMLNAVSPGISHPTMPDIVIKSIQYIENNYSKAITLENLSKELFMEKFNLIRKFKENMGTTPYEYLTRYRLNQAKQLLQTTDNPIYEISSRVGFEDPSHFTKLFKKYENISPKEYKNYFKIDFCSPYGRNGG